MPDGLFLAASFVTGAGVAACGAWLYWGRPLARAARTCRTRAATDLSPTLAEEGPRALRTVARTLNDLDADFQEVLLLFAFIARSAHGSADLLRPLVASRTESPEGDRVRAVLADIDEMQAMIRDFRYFRVSLEGGVVRDVGVAGPRQASPS